MNVNKITKRLTSLRTMKKEDGEENRRDYEKKIIIKVRKEKEKKNYRLAMEITREGNAEIQ